MARISDGRIGVSVNAGTIKVLDLVRNHMLETMGLRVSYTQAIQYLANEYFIQLDNKGLLNNDKLTVGQDVAQGDENE